MPDPTLTQAIREAYASVPSNLVILDTLELRHPDFIDEGEQKAIRIVRDFQDLTARLENNAPLNKGERVTFTALSFDMALPQVESAPIPEIIIRLDNVSRLLMPYVDKACSSPHKIEVTYRPYLSSDLSRPQMEPPLTLTLVEIEADMYSIMGRARMMDVHNTAFPSVLYTPKTFPGLLA